MPSCGRRTRKGEVEKHCDVERGEISQQLCEARTGGQLQQATYHFHGHFMSFGHLKFTISRSDRTQIIK